MADAVNPVQRNIYQRRDGTRYLMEYRHGDGMKYAKSLKGLSWPVKYDVLEIALPKVH